MSEIRRVMGKPDHWTDSPVTLIKYIDDYNGVETLNAHEAITESSSKKQRKLVHAWQSEDVFKKVTKTAAELGMRVNRKKHNCYVSAPP